MSKAKEIDPIERADAERIGACAEIAVRRADAERIENAERQALLRRISGELPDDPAALWLITEQGLGRICMDIVLVGRSMLKLKEILPDGGFEAGLRERGIAPRTARQMMMVARRFSDRSERLLRLGRSKIYAIAEMLNDEQVAQLDAGEDVLGLTLDEAERMTARELRERLKKIQAEIEVKDKLLAEKNKAIDELAGEIERLKGRISRPEDDPRIEQAREAAQRAMAALVDLHALAVQVEDEDLHVAGELHARFEELRPMFAAMRELILTRFPTLHLAMDDASDVAWNGKAADPERMQ